MNDNMAIAPAISWLTTPYEHLTARTVPVSSDGFPSNREVVPGESGTIERTICSRESRFTILPAHLK
jgi:hypothetical protein